MKTDTHTKLINAGPGTIADTTAETIDGRDDAEALKVTYTARAEVAHKHLIGGWEDCLDAVRVGHLHVRDCVMECGPRTRVFVTAKGGGIRHVFENITLRGKPRWWAFSLGDWTLYNARPDMPPMREVILRRVRREDGRRFLVLQIFCDRVVLEDTRAVIINLRWLARIWFRILRRTRRKDPRADQPIPTWLTKGNALTGRVTRVDSASSA